MYKILLMACLTALCGTSFATTYNCTGVNDPFAGSTMELHVRGAYSYWYKANIKDSYSGSVIKDFCAGSTEASRAPVFSQEGFISYCADPVAEEANPNKWECGQNGVLINKGLVNGGSGKVKLISVRAGVTTTIVFECPSHNQSRE